MHPGDLAQLLKRDWKDTNELARELFVLLADKPLPLSPRPGQEVLSQTESSRRPGLSPISRPFSSPRLIAAQAQQQFGTPPTAILQALQSPQVTRAAVQAAIARQRSQTPQASSPTPFSTPTPWPGPALVVTKPPTGIAPGPLTPQLAAVRALRAQREQELANQGLPDVRRQRQVPTASQPVVSPEFRSGGMDSDLMSSEATALATPHTMTPTPVIYRTGVESLAPSRPDRPFDFQSDAGTAELALVAPALSDLPHKDYSSDGWDSRLTRLPMQSFARLLVQLDTYGVPQMTSAAGGQGLTLPMVPGVGNAIILDFDGNQLTSFSGEPMQVFNMGLLPQGSNAFVWTWLMGQCRFIEPPMFGHAIVTQTITPAAGNAFGTGQATPYYMSNGQVVAGFPVTVENWYSVTAQVGKHCGLLACDGTTSLEVLDC